MFVAMSQNAGVCNPLHWRIISVFQVKLFPEVITLAKAGMRRPDPKEPHGTESNRKTHISRNDVAPVPELQGRKKSGKEKVNQLHDFSAKH